MLCGNHLVTSLTLKQKIILNFFRANEASKDDKHNHKRIIAGPLFMNVVYVDL